MLYKLLELEHGWLEWSLFRCILSWLWSEKGGCCLTVNALREKGVQICYCIICCATAPKRSCRCSGQRSPLLDDHCLCTDSGANRDAVGSSSPFLFVIL